MRDRATRTPWIPLRAAFASSNRPSVASTETGSYAAIARTTQTTASRAPAPPFGHTSSRSGQAIQHCACGSHSAGRRGAGDGRPDASRMSLIVVDVFVVIGAHPTARARRRLHARTAALPPPVSLSCRAVWVTDRNFKDWQQKISHCVHAHVHHSVHISMLAQKAKHARAICPHLVFWEGRRFPVGVLERRPSLRRGNPQPSALHHPR